MSLRGAQSTLQDHRWTKAVEKEIEDLKSQVEILKQMIQELRRST